MRSFRPYATFALALMLAADAPAADEPKTVQPPSSPSQFPAPKAKVPELPADGSGIYRLSLDGAIGVPLLVLLDVRDGRVVRAGALPTHYFKSWGEVDATKLTVKDGALSGTLKVKLLPIWHAKNNARVPYDPTRTQDAEFAIDTKCPAEEGIGTYRATWNGPAAHPHMLGLAPKGVVTVCRMPAIPLPTRYEVDVYAEYALVDSGLVPTMSGSNPAVWLRVAFEDGKPVKLMGWFTPKRLEGAPLTISEFTPSLKDGRFRGRLEAATTPNEADAFTLEFDGFAVGTQLFGTVKLGHGKTTMTTPWTGVVNDVTAWRWPTAPPTGKWTWQHDRAADPDLTAAALEESLRPVLPGEPGKAGFSTWRGLQRGNQRHVSVIHPPSFDLKAIDGAAKYVFRLVGQSGETKIEKSFDLDKPWLPFTPVWNDLPAGTYDVTMTALDARGKKLPGAMRMGILDPMTAEPTVQEYPSIRLIKRPPFTGPYATPPTSWTAQILGPARWNREAIGHGHFRGQAPGSGLSFGGEGLFGAFMSSQVSHSLALWTYTDDPAERLAAEDVLRFFREECTFHQAGCQTPGVFHMYKGYTALNHLPGRAILDACLQTGDPRWKEIAVTLARGLVKLQKPNGAFECSNTPRGGPGGYFARWAKGNDEFGSSELLYLLGRIRVDLKTDEFLEAERKAYQWMIDRAVRDRYFPLYDHHSMSQEYPIWQHGHSALYFCRYLLEYAPAKWRDLKLAEELALWAEDHSADWRRAAPGNQSGPIYPRLVRGDRGNDPTYNSMLAAIVFRELSLATGSKLWAAKSEALAAAVTQAVDPKSGWLNRDMNPVVDGPYARQFHDDLYQAHSAGTAGTVQLMREYAALTAPKP